MSKYTKLPLTNDAATFSVQDKHWKLGIVPRGGLSADMEAIVLATWDAETTADAHNIQKIVDTSKTLRRLAIVKFILFPAEQLLTLLLMGTSKASFHRQLIKLYYSFYKKKISLEEFQKSLLTLSKSSIIAL